MATVVANRKRLVSRINCCRFAAPASAPAVAPATAPPAVPACCSTYWPSVSLLQLRHQSINHKTQPQPQKPLQAISQEQRDSTIAIGSARTVQRTQRRVLKPARERGITTGQKGKHTGSVRPNCKAGACCSTMLGVRQFYGMPRDDTHLRRRRRCYQTRKAGF